MFEVMPLKISGCCEIKASVSNDDRGRFVKVFHRGYFQSLGLEADFSEEYYSSSRKGVIRGMHFQVPPADHAKLVYCVHGEAFDVVLDLRVGSPTYGRTASVVLNADRANSLYVARGLAHGFCALSDVVTLVYNVSSVHSPSHDSGVLFDSIDVDWPTDSPVTSERDRLFPPMSAFKSPFIFGE